MFITDVHCHVYPEKIASRAVESVGRFYDIPMGLDGTVDTLLRESKKAGPVGETHTMKTVADLLHQYHMNGIISVF